MSSIQLFSRVSQARLRCSENDYYSCFRCKRLSGGFVVLPGVPCDYLDAPGLSRSYLSSSDNLSLVFSADLPLFVVVKSGRFSKASVWHGLSQFSDVLLNWYISAYESIISSGTYSSALSSSSDSKLGCWNYGVDGPFLKEDWF